jgi:hypothetical protein
VPRNPNLKANVFYDCAICGSSEARYMTPFDQKRYPPRYCSRRCAGIAHRRDGHHSWKGGRVVEPDGYVFIHAPEHPFANQRGYVAEHRLVMERVLGRLLLPEEVVHHEDDDPGNNDPSNLRLFSNQAEYKRFHDTKRVRDEAGRYLPRVA